MKAKSELKGWKIVHRILLRRKIEKALTITAYVLFVLVILMFILFPVPKEVVANSEIKDVNLDEDVIEYIEEVCGEYHICPEVVEAIIESESSCKESAISASKKHYGLMQIGVFTHAKRIDEHGFDQDDMLEAKPNIEVGVELLSELFEEYEDLPVVLMRYEGYSEEDAISLATQGNVPMFTNHIINRAMELERLHGK